MIDYYSIRQFIFKFGKSINAVLAFMDNTGNVIASSSPINQVCLQQTALEMLNENVGYREKTDDSDSPGAEPSVFISVYSNDSIAGIVSVTGDPDESRSKAFLLKAAVETLLENQSETSNSFQNRSPIEYLKNSLLYAEGTSSSELRFLMSRCGFESSVLRACVLISLNNSAEPDTVIEHLKASLLITRNDIAFVSHDESIVIFKTFAKTICEDIILFKAELYEYGEKLFKKLSDSQLDFMLYVGSIQENPTYLKSSFEHCLWLRNNIMSSDKPLFFYDNLQSYFNSLIPLVDIHKVFSAFASSLDDSFCNDYTKTITALSNNGYNLQTSSQELYVHKNTLAFWIKNINSRLSTDILHDFKDRQFSEYFTYYLLNGRTNR